MHERQLTTLQVSIIKNNKIKCHWGTTIYNIPVFYVLMVSYYEQKLCIKSHRYFPPDRQLSLCLHRYRV